MEALLDKDLVAKHFKSCADTYEENAVVQKEISSQLLQILQLYECIDYSRVLEIGCCTGVLTEMLTDRKTVGTIWLNDIVDEYCRATGSRIRANVPDIQFLPGDIEEKKLPGDLTLVLSSSTFQWMNDLSLLTENIGNSLKIGGHLAFSIFGPGTMTEISTLTGRGLRYFSDKELLSHLDRRFHVIHTQKEKKQVFFPTVRAVLRHIQKTGVGGLGKYDWTSARLRKFEDLYISHFGTDLGVPVSYISTFIVAEKR